MVATSTGFREVKNTGLKQIWKDISVPIGEGGSGSGYIVDQKSTDRAGGYGYKDSATVGSPARNRFIYWRSHQDVLELQEVSLDFELTGDCVRLRFHGASIIGDVNIHESHGNVVILVVTTTSVHRLLFPHPNRLQSFDRGFLLGSANTVPSIFTDVSVAGVRDPANCHNYNVAGLTTPYQAHTATSWITAEGEAIYALATSHGSILLIKLPLFGGQGFVQHELKQSSMMHRLWSGFVPSVIRGGADSGVMVTSLLIHPIGLETFIFAISRDHKLRMWSCKSYECVMAADMLEFLPNEHDPSKLTIGDEGHVIRKSVGSCSSSLFLGVFLSFADHCQFCIMQPVMSEGRYQPTHITTIFGPQDDLLDFCLTESHLWALWTTQHGSVVATAASIQYNRPSIQYWQTVTMETDEPGELVVPGHLEAREFYMEQIFSPGRFSEQAIFKALNIFKRSLDASSVQEASVPLHVMKAEISAAIQSEIRSNASNFNISEEEYHNLQLQQWAKFYSCCVQYHERDSKPVGILADENTGLVAVVKKGFTSVFRPCDSVEHLAISPRNSCHVNDFDPNFPLWEDDAVFRDVIQLCECLKLVRLCLTEDYVYSFEQDLYHTQDPVGIADTMVTWLTNDIESREHRNALQEFGMKIQNVQQLDRAVSSLIVELFDRGSDDMMEDAEDTSGRQLALSRLFASQFGASIMCRSVQQLAKTRLDLSRDILILLTLVLKNSSQIGITVPVINELRQFVAKASVLVRSYFLVKWCSEVVVTPVSASQLELNVRCLEALGLLDLVGNTRKQDLESDSCSMTLLELFLLHQGGEKVREILSHDAVLDEDPCAVWSKVLRPFVKALAQILWPYNGSLFGVFLLSRAQYSSLLDYTRLTQGWCDANKSTNRFLMALAYLCTGEATKAMECFMQMPLRGATEDFIQQLVAVETEDADPKVMYFLKVLGLFEQFNYPHLAVEIAKNAISFADDGDPHVPTLWSKVFKNELEMGHNEQAYSAMLSNPDKERRRDCLRQFLVVLCERSELQTLVDFTYKDRHVVLEEEVVSILESRARSIDLTKHNYYDLLYAFHIYRNNYRKAGTIMYEYGTRLGCEVLSVKGLQKQAKCYLAALNALRLIDPDNAWILKPPMTGSGRDEEQDEPAHKRDIEGQLKFSKKKNKMTVLELEDVEKEYILVNARLQLMQKAPETAYMAGATTNASETIGLLVNAGLFDSAINICKMFNMSMVPVFDALAARCVYLAQNSEPFMKGDNDYTSEAWNWLQQNTLVPANVTREASSSDHAWRLLQKYLEQYEDRTTQYHKCVTVKLLSHGFSLPPWLSNTYKELNAAELLHLYLDYDLLPEASLLTLEYIDAVLGTGWEYFGLKSFLKVGSSAVWLPYTAIDQLLAALEDVHYNTQYFEFREKIQEKLNKYFDTAKQVSEDTIRAEMAKQTVIQRVARQNIIAMET